MIELLVVVLVMMLLMTLMWSPRTGKREQARRAACARQLEKLFISLQIYANEHAGAYPATPEAKTAGEALQLLVPRYTSDIASFICPAKPETLREGEPLSRQKISYAYFMGCFATNSQQVLLSDAQVDTQSKAAGQLAFSADGKPPGANHGQRGGNLLFCDGR
ncbi:MAG TPA: hypothetical protein VN673_13800, partial [Clostridia bacterium]|nr:hypothetical protein [Clostridia bacterium]